MKCGLCGHKFTQDEVRCHPACPLVGNCPVVCCPRCGYQTPDESRSTLLRLGRRARALARRGWRHRRGAPLMDEQGKALPLSELRAGRVGRVAYIGTDDSRRLEQLSSLGIVPGVVIRLLQNQLAAVVRVGETEVAIDFDIARQIYVRPHTFRGSKSGRT
jgi:Fe2+ transport system protein FeoA